MLQSSVNQVLDTLKKFWDMIVQEINFGEKISEEDLNTYLITLSSTINLLSEENFSKYLDEKIADIILNVIKNYFKKDDVDFLYKMLKNLGADNSRKIFDVLKNYLYFWKKSTLVGNKLSDNSKLAYLILFEENQIIYLLNELSSQQLFKMFNGNVDFEKNFFSNDREKVINIGDFRKKFFYALSKTNESKEVQNFYFKLVEKFSFQDYFFCLPTIEAKKNLFKIIFEVGAKYPPYFHDDYVDAHRIWQSFFKSWRKIYNEDKSIVFEILTSKEIKNIIQNSGNDFLLNFFLKYWDNKIEINKVREIIFSHLKPKQKRIFFECFNDNRKPFVNITHQIFKSFFAENYLSHKEKISLFNLIFNEHKAFEFIAEYIEEFSEDVKEHFFNLLYKLDSNNKNEILILLDEFDNVNELIDFFSKFYSPEEAINFFKSLNLKNENNIFIPFAMDWNFDTFSHHTLNFLNSLQKFIVFRTERTKNNYLKCKFEIQAYIFIALLENTQKLLINNDTYINFEYKPNRNIKNKINTNYEDNLKICFADLQPETKVLIYTAINNPQIFIHILEPLKYLDQIPGDLDLNNKIKMSEENEIYFNGLNKQMNLENLSINKDLLSNDIIQTFLQSSFFSLALPTILQCWFYKNFATQLNLQFNNFPLNLQTFTFLYSINEYVKKNESEKITNDTKIPMKFLNNYSISFSELEGPTQDLIHGYIKDKTYFLSLIDSNFNKSSVYEKFLCDCLPPKEILVTTLNLERNLNLGETNRASFSNLFTEENLTSSDLFLVQGKSSDEENCNTKKRKIMPSTSEPSNLRLQNLLPIPPMITRTSPQIDV